MYDEPTAEVIEEYSFSSAKCQRSDLDFVQVASS